MSKLKYALIDVAFQTVSITGISKLIRSFSACRGIIFTLHRILPDPIAPFQPNAILQITPDFLQSVIVKARKNGFDIISLDEALERIKSIKKQNKFIVLTFDDAYRDNLIYALPILQKHQCPFTLYVPTAFIDGRGELWWQLLEDIVQENEEVSFDGLNYQTNTIANKQNAYEKIYWHMRSMDEQKRQVETSKFAIRYNVDMSKHCQNLIMNWQELQIFADEPLCTIGAHTIHHYELAKLSKQDAKKEMQLSADILEEKFNKRPKHFSYPIGAKRSASKREYQLATELGFTSAVTTLPGGLYSKHKEQLNHLPRISLNGLFQKQRYIDVFLTGAFFGR